ncbi:MAG: hypothetical protein RR444_09455 [Oscillospiraceae bacterium]
MPVSKSKRIANDKWDRKNMVTLGCKVKKEEAEAFKEFAAAQGVTSNTVLKKFVQSCIVKSPILKNNITQQRAPTVLVISQEKNSVNTGEMRKKKRKMTKNAARKIIQDKMDVLRAENRAEEYDVILHNLLAITPKSKTNFMRILENANIKDEVMIEALLVFHKLKDGEAD